MNKIVDELKKAYEQYTKENNFEKGQIVVLKPGMQKLYHEEMGFIEGPFIVVDILNPPVISTNAEIMEVLVGAIIDGYFELFYLDKRKLKIYEG